MPHYTTYGGNLLTQNVNENQDEAQVLTISEKFVGEGILNQNLNAIEKLEGEQEIDWNCSYFKKQYESGPKGNNSALNSPHFNQIDKNLISSQFTNYVTNSNSLSNLFDFLKSENSDLIKNHDDIDNLTGLGLDLKDFANDFFSTKGLMEGLIDQITNGFIGGRPWSEFAVHGSGGNMAKYIGIGHEAYECADEGMTNAWNKKEQQLCEGTGGEVCEDLNGDGYVGNAPSSGDCDGETGILGKLWDAAKDLVTDNNDNKKSENDDDDDESKASGCFEKPWEYDHYTNFGSGFETYGQSPNEIMNNFGNEFETYGQQNFVQDNILAATGNFF